MPKEAQSLVQTADKLRPVVQSGLTAGLLSFRERVDVGEVRSAIERGAFSDVEDLIPWGELTTEISAVGNVSERGILDGAEKTESFLKGSASVLGVAAAAAFVFNRSAPAVSREVNLRTGILGQRLEEGSRQAVRNVIVQAQLGGLSPAATAKLVKDVIGLSSKRLWLLRILSQTLRPVVFLVCLLWGVVLSRLGWRVGI